MTLSLRVPAVFLGLLVVGCFALFLLRNARATPVRADPPDPNADAVAPLPAGELTPRLNVVRQGFPAGKADPNDLTKSETAWEIEWELTHPLNRPFYPPGSVLRIKSAKFMWKDRTGKPHWVVVARMLELAEIYVPYDDGHTAFMMFTTCPFTSRRPARIPGTQLRVAWRDPEIAHPPGTARSTKRSTTTAFAG